MRSSFFNLTFWCAAALTLAGRTVGPNYYRTTPSSSNRYEGVAGSGVKPEESVANGCQRHSF
jgi:hypothetical protein